VKNRRIGYASKLQATVNVFFGSIATGSAAIPCPPMSGFYPIPTVKSRHWICRDVPTGDIRGRNKPASASSKRASADQSGWKGTSTSIPLSTVFRLASRSGRRCAGGESALGRQREVRAKRRGDAVGRSAGREEAEILTVPADQERETRVVDIDVGPLQGLGLGVVDLVVVRDLANCFGLPVNPIMRG
jgi:hypothetical protein